MKTFWKGSLLYQSIILPLPLSMLLVIHQVSMACTVSEFSPPLPGRVQGLAMTAHSLLKSKMSVAFEAWALYIHIKLFFSFSYEGEEYPCALVEWFKKDSRSPNEQTGMWVVKPEEDHHGKRSTTIVHLDTILRGAHLIPVYGSCFIPPHFCHSWSLDAFKAFFVNKYADHHANRITF